MGEVEARSVCYHVLIVNNESSSSSANQQHHHHNKSPQLHAEENKRRQTYLEHELPLALLCIPRKWKKHGLIAKTTDVATCENINFVAFAEPSFSFSRCCVVSRCLQHSPQLNAHHTTGDQVRPDRCARSLASLTHVPSERMRHCASLTMMLAIVLLSSSSSHALWRIAHHNGTASCMSAYLSALRTCHQFEQCRHCDEQCDYRSTHATDTFHHHHVADEQAGDAVHHYDTDTARDRFACRGACDMDESNTVAIAALDALIYAAGITCHGSHVVVCCC